MFSLLTLRKQHQNAEAGFTLIELLVVILIIGVLTTIAIPVFLNQRKAAVEASLKQDLHSISLNMENCILKDKSIYPELWVNWSGNNITPPCFSDLKLSNGTQAHSYDMAFHPPAGWTVPAGQVYCVEVANTSNPTGYYFFRSDKGVFTNSSCQTQ